MAWNCCSFLSLWAICSVVSASDECTELGACPAATEELLEADREALLQLSMVKAEENNLGFNTRSRYGTPSRDTCSALVNQGSHHTVAVEIGTPPQKFALVVDTGSSHVIVDSCICQDRFLCPSSDRCFIGTNRSTSFFVETRTEHGYTIPNSTVSIEFGSGYVEAAIASDIVKVGAKKANMTKSLYLMIGKLLDFGGPFEGILGLGIPDTRYPDGFMEKAAVPHFSVCFNAETDGVLRLSPASSAEKLSAVGKKHWTLGFDGFSIGDGPMASSICSKLAKQTDRNKSCMGIVDSGTTNIMAPKLHIVSLFADICSRWPRCQKSEKGSSKDTEKMSHAFQEMLLDCNSFTNGSQGLNQELPPLHFHLIGSNGRQRKLTLPGVGYVWETMRDEIRHVHKNLLGIFPVDVSIPTGKKKKVCTPAFGKLDVTANYTGPVWVLGQPLFFEYRVGYELTSHPPSISFSQGQCGSCENGLAQSAPISFVGQGLAPRRPVLVRGPARLPSIDFSQPL